MTIIAVLNTGEEEAAQQKWKKHSRDMCRNLLDDLVNCTRSKTITIGYACKEPNQKVQECLKQYSTEEWRDKFREDELRLKKEFLVAHGRWPSQYQTSGHLSE
ncbi:hypothetical protein BASA82_000813 [Batrachochytrium salamandrivorans]|uniref:COX assembly mitochondrial protein n=1 Tax=Batrachochytrium salamandrivorans TaxID=1357716 RepID=A0ABQ8FAA3_9FUNG|nr:hypothetical protein BASA60_007626 [Batrachochytrium salamandrivorans]KAH6589674.1 hypothetical protein BASA61_005554 [Batrachochytrium salamandrivorans]KAH6594810.1 hypothetical protein BASA50_006284 [Batrachochytrium salamandrivorans]KAH9257416.1 hypothetical protein BASA81_004341 [Batrachochytrium salamandrivorans]KAH9262135.1 hypothetical protein BASA82_000813 [Batrachochytrium salamandrivorans]